MTSKKQGQWNQVAAQKLEQAKQRAQAPWDSKGQGRARKSSKYPFARVFTGCSY